ncbi:uncharacterized protein MELLADRAFT_71533 [Melampsora larici-populina 98AG31]|uniref:Uncharacterized protein n=1 Tax=Melampsora larici-populina (strain 98AG31 / pathotype 3-4-7) TaxID=747676 RepID=F4RHD8_MELLP|nr:uncharacterized protein MELLADRAFT_71533 [Melampsora larici-populina 98AG31]EGG08264.1 hypothetical protein MELLADRAFT_71533 [Melampsora larici-populina 98AG31]
MYLDLSETINSSSSKMLSPSTAPSESSVSSSQLSTKGVKPARYLARVGPMPFSPTQPNSQLCASPLQSPSASSFELSPITIASSSPLTKSNLAILTSLNLNPYPEPMDEVSHFSDDSEDSESTVSSFREPLFDEEQDQDTITTSLPSFLQTCEAIGSSHQNKPSSRNHTPSCYPISNQESVVGRNEYPFPIST